PGIAGCSYLTTASFTVVAPPQPTANVQPAACNTCNNGSINVQTNASTNCTYTLIPANGGPTVASATGQFNNLLPGTYIVNAHCAGGCNANITVTVGVNGSSGPQVSFSGLQSQYCVGPVNILPMFQLTGNPPGGTFSMSPPQPDGTPGITPDGWFYPYGWAPGTYTVTYTVEINGTTYSTSQTTVVNQAPEAQITPIGFQPGQTLCANGQVYNLMGTPYGGTFQGPGIIDNNPGFAYIDPGQIPPGTHVYSYSGVAENGCEYHATLEVTVGALQLTVQNLVHPSCGDCADGQFTIGVLGSGGPYMFTVNVSPSGATWTQSQPVFTGLGAGTYSVQVQSAGGCSGTIIVVLGGPNPPPPPPACVSPVEIGHEILDNGEVRVNWNPVPGAQGYRVRYRRDGTPGWVNLQAGGNSIVLENLAPGTYIVQVQALCGNNAGGIVESAWSANHVFTLQGPPPPPPPPACVSPVEIGHEVLDNGEVRVNWNPVPG
ncbi:MAG: fibronectin type III domain-containing protein, partial [Bacteroidia bacterium]|nr:fibronectin type III domain-containing protein [Bacteroidia bacterium]